MKKPPEFYNVVTVLCLLRLLCTPLNFNFAWLKSPRSQKKPVVVRVVDKTSTSGLNRDVYDHVGFRLLSSLKSCKSSSCDQNDQKKLSKSYFTTSFWQSGPLPVFMYTDLEPLSNGVSPLSPRYRCTSYDDQNVRSVVAERKHDDLSLEDIDLIDCLWRQDADVEKGLFSSIQPPERQFETDLRLLSEKTSPLSSSFQLSIIDDDLPPKFDPFKNLDSILPDFFLSSKNNVKVKEEVKFDEKIPTPTLEPVCSNSNDSGSCHSPSNDSNAENLDVCQSTSRLSGTAGRDATLASLFLQNESDIVTHSLSLPVTNSNQNWLDPTDLECHSNVEEDSFWLQENFIDNTHPTITTENDVGAIGDVVVNDLEAEEVVDEDIQSLEQVSSHEAYKTLLPSTSGISSFPSTSPTTSLVSRSTNISTSVSYPSSINNCDGLGSSLSVNSAQSCSSNGSSSCPASNTNYQPSYVHDHSYCSNVADVGILDTVPFVVEVSVTTSSSSTAIERPAIVAPSPARRSSNQQTDQTSFTVYTPNERDHQLVEINNLGVSADDIINLPFHLFQALILHNPRLSAYQVETARKIRRRGRNREAAQSYRNRRAETFASSDTARFYDDLLRLRLQQIGESMQSQSLCQQARRQ